MRPGSRLGRVAVVSAAALLGGALSVAVWDAGGASEASEGSELLRPDGVAAPTVPTSTTSSQPPPDPTSASRRAAASGVTARAATPPPVVPESRRAPTAMQLPGDVDMALEPVGVSTQGSHAGQMEIPADPSVGGWYRFGAAPGDPAGAVVVAAHADRAGRGPGPLARLDRLEPGAQIRLTVGRREFRYRIERVEIVDKAELEPAALFSTAGPPRLHVVSCGGDYDATARRYAANVVATGSLIR